MAEDTSFPVLEDALIGDEGLGLESPRISRFEVVGLFGRPLDHKIDFPTQSDSASEPNLLILMGPNGSGKTTALRMIDGMVRLDFDMFRKTPFSTAKLTLSTGQELFVEPQHDKNFPLRVSFGHHSVALSSDKQGYSPEHRAAIDLFRSDAGPDLQNIRFQLIDIHRSLALRNLDVEERPYADRAGVKYLRPDGRRAAEPSRELAAQVTRFVRDAQVNYRRFFAADQLELLPRILASITGASGALARKPDLAARISKIKARSPVMARIGLQTDDPDLDTLSSLLSSESHNDNASLAVLSTYVATQEIRSQTRELIAERLLSFEALMDDFLVGKTIRIDPRRGLRIDTNVGTLNETDLSSGEYHFLSMMVTALISHRTGSVIAIDEPELSLHVVWQRKIIRALRRCASGASPLFLFATHSAAISAEHRGSVNMLAVED